MSIPTYKKTFMAGTPEERLLAKCGVPAYAWKIQLKEFAFRSTAFRGGKLSAHAQGQWCRNIILDPPYNPLFIISSAPTDTAAVALLSWMFRHRINSDRRASFGTPGTFNYSRMYTTICLHNVLNEATPARREEVRDVLLANDESFRVVAIGGSKNPEGWALNSLRVRPTAVFYLKDFT